MSFPAPETYAGKLRTAINKARDYLEGADDLEGEDNEKARSYFLKAREILDNAAHMTEDVCPQCGKNLSYSYGEMMTDSILYCGCNSNVGFEREADGQWTQITLLPKTEHPIYARWTHKKYGQIPPQTLTIGEKFSPYDNPRFEWFEPDLSDFAGLVEKIKKLTAVQEKK